LDVGLGFDLRDPVAVVVLLFSVVFGQFATNLLCYFDLGFVGCF